MKSRHLQPGYLFENSTPREEILLNKIFQFKLLGNMDLVLK